MKKTSFVVTLLILLIAGFFIYSRYRTKRMDDLIGLSKEQIEARYRGIDHQLEYIDPKDPDEVTSELLKEKGIEPKGSIQKLSVKGSVRKMVFWMADEGQGYYVIEALEMNR